MSIANNCRFIGRISKNIEITPMNNGKNMAKISLAVQRDFKNASGEYDCDFISLVAFGTNADLLMKYAEKGDEIVVESNCRPRSYENKDGKTIFLIEFIVDSFKVLRRKTNQTTITETTQHTTTPAYIQPQVTLMEKYPNGIICADAELPF